MHENCSNTIFSVDKKKSTQFLQLKKKIIQLSSAASPWNVGTTSLWVGNIAKDYTSITENLSKILACLQIIEAQ